MAQASVLMRSQIGLETSRGLLVPASRKLNALGIDPAIQLETDAYAPMGLKYDTLVNLNREWVSAGLTGKPTFTEFIYVLSSLIGKTTPTIPGTATTAKLWTFSDISDAAADPQTFTVETVGPDRSSRFGYALITDMTLNISRSALDMSGTMIGQKYEDAITATTTGLTEIALIPVLPSQISVYMDDTAATLGTTKLTRDFVANLSIGGKYGPVYALDAAQGSFATHVDLKPTLSLELQMEKNAVGMTPLTAVRAGATKFIRVEAVGALIETGHNYTMTLDFAGKVSATSNGDADGLAVVNWTFGGVHDSVWGKAYLLSLKNSIASM